ncbi:hypothetical protein C1645_777649 [Glomus cerebriforme]|uniref:Uncharacterized protein n=1 Tax=Glomus cerebriforme TaxID=658196 RepID=A0A397SQX3_9GLOM|nr:hypothetical protein C1645_777649 [Glomus cerebriforme]
MSQSYQIPTEKEKDNKTSLQARRSDSVSVTMVSTTPLNSAAKPIQQLPDSTLSHLENIFEAVKKQVSIWGERARWKIDLVLLPAEDEDTENSNQVVGGSSNQQQSGLHTPTSDNAGDTPASAHGQLQLTTTSTQTQPPQVQFNTQAENVRVENPMRYTLDDDTIEKLDIESAKHMLKEVILHIRAYESMLNRVSRETESKIKEAQTKVKKANEHIESMAKFHSIREKEKTSKHSVELKILQEDVKILSRKYKEANAQLADVKAKYASLQEQVARSKETDRRNMKRKAQSKTTDMVGKIVEYVPQQQTNGYLTYNFPYVQKMPPQQNPQKYSQNQQPQQLNPPPPSSSPSVQYSNGRSVLPPAYASQQEDPNRRNFPPYQITQTLQNNSSHYPPYPSNQLHSENNRPVFSPYSFPQHHQSPQDIRQTQSATYPMQMNNLPTSTQPRVVPAYNHIQQNIPVTPTIASSIPTYISIQKSERSGLDNLSLAAELILSSLPSSTSTQKHNGQQTISNSSIIQKSSSREVSSSSDCSTISIETPINVVTIPATNTSLVETPINIRQTNGGMSTPSTPPPSFNTRLINSSKNISTPDTITAADDDTGYQSIPIYTDRHSIHTLSPPREVYEDNHSSSGDETDEFIDGEGNHQVLEESKSDIKFDLETEGINGDVTSNHEESEEETNGPLKKKRRLSNVKRVPPPVQIF